MSNNEIKEIKRIVKNYKDSLPEIKILIFGPSEQNPDTYASKCFQKRIDIKTSLSGRNCIVILPEEAFNEAKKQGTIQNITAFEKYLIEQEYDLVMFLYVPNCPGVDHELSLFSALPEDCVRKMLLFYAQDGKFDPEWAIKDKIKFIRGGHGRVEPFCENDIDQCHVREKATEIIEEVRTFLGMHPYKKYEGVR